MQAAHAAISHMVSFPIAFLHPLLALAIILAAIEKTFTLNRIDVVLLGALLLMAMPSTLHILSGSLLDAQFLLLGVGAIAVGLFLSKVRASTQRNLCIGLTAWAATFIIAWTIDTIRFVQANEWARVYSLEQLVMVMRYPNDPTIDVSLIYPILIGNVNKASNVFVLGAILIIGLSCERRKFGAFSCVAMPIVALATLLTFSRGGMIALGGLAAAVMISQILLKGRISLLVAWNMVWMFLPLAVTIASSQMRGIWLEFSSLESRVQQLAQVAETKAIDNLSPFSALFGNGIGSYGEQLFGYSFAGTHNLFVDVFLAGGILQVIGLLVLFCLPITQAFKASGGNFTARIGGLGLIGVSFLSFREFDLNYLGVSAFPALLVGFLAGMSTSCQVDCTRKRTELS